MPLAIEFVHLQVNEAFRKDPGPLIQPIIDFVSPTPGCIGFYWGFTEEDKNVVYLAILWESVEHHLAIVNDKENYPTLIAAVTKCVEAPPDVFHVHVKQEENISAVLNAPVTSFGHVIGLKPEHNPEALLEVLGPLSKSIAPKGGRGGCAAKLLERPEYILIYGWDSLEDHRNAVEADEGFKNLLANSRAMVTEVKRAHVKFITVKPYNG